MSAQAPAGDAHLTAASRALRSRAFHLLSGGTVIAIGIASGVLNMIGRYVPTPIDILFILANFALAAVLLWYWWSAFHRRNAHFAWHRQLEPAILAWLERKGVPSADLAAVRASASPTEGQVSSSTIVIWLCASILGDILFLVWTIQVRLALARADYWSAEDVLADSLTSPSFILGCIVVCITAPVCLYLMKRVLEGYHFHERRENVFLRLLAGKAAQHGLDLSIPLDRRRAIGWRNFWLQVLVLPLVTCAVYLLWTAYYIFQDGTSHAEHHLKWEDSLLAALARDGIAVGATAPSAALASVPPVSVSQIMLWGAPHQQPGAVSAAIQQTVPAAAAPASPPAVPADAPAERLRELDRLRQDGLITQEEYEAKKRAILSDL
jgi:hypothetical protein